MQVPKTRNSCSSDMAHKTPSTATPRVARPLKLSGDTVSVSSSNSVTRVPTEMSPKVTGRSPRSPASELQKKRSPRASELDPKISQLREDLKKAKDQLSLSEVTRKKLQQDVDETKKELAAMTAKLDESQHRLIELSASKEARVIELHKISQEKDCIGQSELNMIQNRNSGDSAALVSAKIEIQKLKHELYVTTEDGKHDEDFEAELQVLKHDLSRSLSLVDDLSDQLKYCRDSEAEAHALANETLQNLQTANSTIEILKSEGLQYRDALNSINLQLLEAESKIPALEQHVSSLQSDLIGVDGKPLLDLGSQLNAEIDYAKKELEQLRYAIEEIEARLHEAETETMMKIQTADEAMETVKIQCNSFIAMEMEMVSAMKTSKSDLEKLRKQVSELQANLMDKETELQMAMEENEGLKGNRKEQESKVALSNVLADAEAAKARERETLLKLDAATTEKAKSASKAARLAEQLEFAQSSNAAMESELKRLRIQTEQWKKAADAAAAVLSTMPNGESVERTGSMDSSAYSYTRLGSPFYEDMDENSPRKKNALKRIGKMWKRKSQNK